MELAEGFCSEGREMTPAIKSTVFCVFQMGSTSTSVSIIFLPTNAVVIAITGDSSRQIEYSTMCSSLVYRSSQGSQQTT
jgi:hypothetical protein